MKSNFKCCKHLYVLIIFSALCCPAFSQTEHDAIMMNKSQWCNGATYMHSQWSDYWEGTFKRNNGNIGTITTQSVMYMTNYGITNNLNILGSIPYVWTNASKGTLHGMKGFQDASLFVKWRAPRLKYGGGKLSLFAVGGLSTPLGNYTPDFLPLSIGMGSTNVSGRVTADYQHGIFFAAASAAYVRRSNVKLDRTAYYTTEIHYTNEVKMPNQAMYNFSAGIRKKYLVAEAIVYNTTTLGGFDIRKNDMPFSSNRMNSTAIGAHVKYTLPRFTQIELTADANRVVAGRNTGQAFTCNAGVFYIFSFRKNNLLSNHLQNSKK